MLHSWEEEQRSSDLYDALRAFTRTISATGGIRHGEDGRPFEPVNESSEWVDLADCYVRACELLGETPVIEHGGKEEPEVI